jgi:sugar transferase (PEP-CTERM/EpsH1 system associated)
MKVNSNFVKAGNRINVLHVVNELSPAGKELGIIKLAKHLNKEKFNPIIISFSGIQSFGILDISDTKVVSLNKKSGNDWSLPFKIYQYCKRNKIHIIHTHSWGTLVEGIIGAKLARVPAIIHGEHGTLSDKKRHRTLQKIFWGFASQVLAVSNNLKKQMNQITGFPENKIKVIYNGVDEHQFYPSKELSIRFRQKFGFSENDFIIGTVGRFHKIKNQAMFLKAAAELVKAGRLVQIILVSGGHLENDLRELAGSLGILKFTHFLGLQEDINLILNGFDIFALTSFAEGCSNVVQEAMHCEKAIVATDVGGTPELITDGNNGYLIESNNYQELSRRLLFLMNNPGKLKEVAGNARKRALRQFSLLKMVQSYEELYLAEFHLSD